MRLSSDLFVLLFVLPLESISALPTQQHAPQVKSIEILTRLQGDVEFNLQKRDWQSQSSGASTGEYVTGDVSDQAAVPTAVPATSSDAQETPSATPLETPAPETTSVTPSETPAPTTTTTATPSATSASDAKQTDSANPMPPWKIAVIVGSGVGAILFILLAKCLWSIWGAPRWGWAKPSTLLGF